MELQSLNLSETQREEIESLESGLEKPFGKDNFNSKQPSRKNFSTDFSE